MYMSIKKFFLFSITVAIAACGKPKSSNKQAELDSLKKVQSEVKGRILALEEELNTGDSADAKLKQVAVTEMMPQPFTHFIEVQAKVEGDEDVTVGAESMGTVTGILVKAGDKVSKGQVLATLDDKMMQQSVAEVRTQLDLATTVYNRQKNLWDQKIGSEVQYLQAKANKEAMEKRFSSVQEQWDKTRIKSPINGTVDEVNIKVGQGVAPGMPSVRVVNLSSLKVKGEVAESFISKVRTGSDVVLFFPDMDKEVKTKLTYSGQAINRLNRTFNVEVRLSPKDGNFHPNQVVVLRIADYSSKAFTVPVGAVQKSSDGEFVYIATAQGGKTVAKRKTVKAGMTYQGVTEIKDGLVEGDRVITNGYQNVVEGDQVKI
jgi:membrane fusion protein, multidrug efflux system